MLRKITFVLPEDKPNGFTVQDELLKYYQPITVTFAQFPIDETNAHYQGWTHNSSTGTIDFSEIGGIADGTLVMTCQKL